MIVEFGEEYLRDLYTKGECSDKSIVTELMWSNVISAELII